ncbi:hypothetical protein CEXT_198151 [Caerostris extrusa]|uniref:Uncharacterized protein n=1 Tax=Caerostris extrusa TaxID=172846 RepID=A0AAV4NAT3_CAEEX|nr:hypothetical protein CEXT_198151 [Caerostris extrusa]
MLLPLLAGTLTNRFRILLSAPYRGMDGKTFPSLKLPRFEGLYSQKLAHTIAAKAPFGVITRPFKLLFPYTYAHNVPPSGIAFKHSGDTAPGMGSLLKTAICCSKIFVSAYTGSNNKAV